MRRRLVRTCPSGVIVTFAGVARSGGGVEAGGVAGRWTRRSAGVMARRGAAPRGVAGRVPREAGRGVGVRAGRTDAPETGRVSDVGASTESSSESHGFSGIGTPSFPVGDMGEGGAGLRAGTARDVRMTPLKFENLPCARVPWAIPVGRRVTV